MRMAVAATALGLTLLAAGALAACSPEDPVEPPGPVPSRTPIFASEEEALAAAEELYARYLSAENELGAGGWNDISLVAPFVRGAALADEIETAESLSSDQLAQEGEIEFDSMSLQQLDDGGAGFVELTAYLCLDVSKASIVDSSGDQVAIERPDRLALEIDMNDVDGALKIERSEAWTGSDFC